VLVDDCVADEKIAPDLVLLSAEQAPPDVAVLALPAKPAAEYGEAYAHAYFARLDDTQDFPGHISPSITARGHRNFSGPSETQYWPEPGSSGCPTFLRQNSLFAGVMRIAEIGANLGRSQLREAVIVPASTIRRHVTRIAFNRAAQALGAEPDRFANVRKHVCALDLPVSGISRVVGEIICDMRGAGGGFEPEPPPSRPSPDSTAAIQASRDKVHALQPDAALDILDARIAEKQEAYTADVVPLLVERARFLRLTYDREAARTTLGEIARLLPDDVWCRVEFGDLWWIDGARTQAAEAFRDALTVAVRTGDTSRIALCHDRIGGVLVAQGDRAGALTAFRDSLAIAQRLAQADPGNAEWQRDLSVSHDRIGGVLVAQGDRAGALTAFRDSLAIAQRLAQADPGNAEWQVDVLWVNWRLASAGDEPARRWGMIVGGLRSLAANDKLTAEQAGWLSVAETNLASLDHSGTGLQEE
jgi:tetratricopeptide (TPR) repeat protein